MAVIQVAIHMVTMVGKMFCVRDFGMLKRPRAIEEFVLSFSKHEVMGREFLHRVTLCDQ